MNPFTRALEEVDQLIAARRAALEQLVDVQAALQRAAGLAPAAASGRASTKRATAAPPAAGGRAAGRGRARPIAPGTVPARVLEILAEGKRPMRAKEICTADAGAKPHHVMAALRDLVRAGRVRRRGATVSLRYVLPQFDHDGQEAS